MQDKLKALRPQLLQTSEETENILKDVEAKQEQANKWVLLIMVLE